MELIMFKKLFLFVRALIGLTTLILLTWIFLNEIQRNLWYPNLIEILLVVIAFITLANGVSYLSETLKKDIKILKLLTGILSFAVFVITFIPQKRDAHEIISLTALIGVVGSSILISWFSTLEWMQFKIIFRWFFPFLFALFSGVYGFFVPVYIFRGFNLEQGAYFYGFLGGILFVFCIILNYFAAFKSNKIYSE
jgi:hypothetical protein